MTEKRYELVKDYDCDGNWEYAYQNNETGKRYNFADENCDYEFLKDINNSYMDLKKENEQLKYEMGELGTAHAEEINSIEDKFDEEILKLEKENEQLKQDGLYWAQTAEARRKEIDKLRKDNTILKQQRDYLFDVIDEVLPCSGSRTAYNRMKDIGDV